MTHYEQPLDQARMAELQPEVRAQLCDRLETMWHGLQQDIEKQRDYSERGVDPRLQQLQLQIVKVEAQLWRMLTAPMPQPAEETDPVAAASQARDEAMRVLLEVEQRSQQTKQPPDTSWIEMTGGR